MSDKEAAEMAALLRDLGWTVEPPGEARYGCHCDIFAMPDGYEPDGCVLDEGRPQDCAYADGIKRKEQCEYWQRITPESIRKARGA